MFEQLLLFSFGPHIIINRHLILFRFLMPKKQRGLIDAALVVPRFGKRFVVIVCFRFFTSVSRILSAVSLHELRSSKPSHCLLTGSVSPRRPLCSSACGSLQIIYLLNSILGSGGQVFWGREGLILIYIKPL